MKRPKFLSIWLILMGLSDILALYSYTLGKDAIIKKLPHFPVWAIPVYAILTFSQLIGVVLLWKWKKVGFYIITVGMIIAGILNAMLLGISSIFAGIVGFGILYLLIKPIWKEYK